MKKVLLVAAILFAGNVNAAEITSRITDSVSLKVNPKIVISEPTSASYTVSGSNITAGTLGGVGGAGSYSVKNDGQAFTFSETNSAVGVVTTTQDFGVAGNLAGELKANTVPTITAGGANTEATAQRSIELSVFK
jgi:hypothetical protein